MWLKLVDVLKNGFDNNDKQETTKNENDGDIDVIIWGNYSFMLSPIQDIGMAFIL